jgi:Xaa-Pro aminopeptidase
LGTQQVVDTSVAKAATHMRDLHDLLVQIQRGLVSLRRMAVAVAGEPHKTARAAFGQMVLAHHAPNRLAPSLWG